MRRATQNIFLISMILCISLAGGLAASGLAADIYWVQGVIELSDGRPVENVAVYLDGQPAATTGVSGLYFIPEAAAGEHTIQPVKIGYTFVPESVKVTLPPDAGDVNFTAFEASGGEEPAVLVPVVQEEAPPTVGNNLRTLFSGLLALWQQLQILLILLSLGAFLVLAARWLANKTWNRHPVIEMDGPQGEIAEPGIPWEAVDAPGPEHLGAPESASTSEVEPPPDADYSPGDEEIADWLKQGTNLIRKGDLAQGMTLLREVTQAKPGNAEAWFWLGAGSIAQNERRTAERCFKQAQRLGHPRAGEALEMLQRKQ